MRKEGLVQDRGVVGKVLLDPFGVLHRLTGPFRGGDVLQMQPHHVEAHLPGQDRGAEANRLVQ